MKKSEIMLLNPKKRAGSRAVFVLIFLFSSLLSLAQNRNEVLENQVFRPELRTVMLHPAGLLAEPAAQLLNGGSPLVLDFDILGDEQEYFAAKIINCRADWTPSDLAVNNFLNDYNEFYLRDFAASFNTKTKYVHYRFQLPKVLFPGNYVLIVFPEGREDEPVLQRRFWVYEDGAQIGTEGGTIVGSESAIRNQQIDFRIAYGNYQIPDPKSQVKVVIRQNYRDDNALIGLVPTFVREFDKTLIYKYFNMENTFRGGNEFRIFDSRNRQGRGFNVQHFVMYPEVNRLVLMKDKSRQGFVYYQINEDLDGRFLPGSTDIRDPANEADYSETVFTFEAPHDFAGRIFVGGGFSGWSVSPEYELELDSETGLYHKTLLLKQGLYDYCYFSASADYQNPDFEVFEGSHARTENTYEIFVYYRAYGSRSDRLIGYRLFRQQK